MRTDLVGACVSTSNGHSGGRWIVALSFLGLGLLAGWLHGYYTGKHEALAGGAVKDSLPGDLDAE